MQERSQQQVREKLADYGVFGDEAEEIIAELISLDFINEERFAEAYVRGKFKIKRWGRKKILQGLAQHKISDYCVKKGLLEIDEEIYRDTLRQVHEKYRLTLREKDPYKRRNKITRYLLSRGFEPDLVYELLNKR